MKPILLTGFRPTGDLHLGHYLSLIKPLLRYKNEYQIFLMVADLHAQTELRRPKVNYQCFWDDLNLNTMIAIQTITSFVDAKDLVIFRQSDLRKYHLDLFYKLLMISRHNQTFGNPIFIDAMKTELFKSIDLLKLDYRTKNDLKRYINNHPEILHSNINDGHVNELYYHLNLPGGPVVSIDLLAKIVKHLNSRIGVIGFATYPILMAADIILYQPEYTLVGKDQSPHIQITNDLVKIMNKTFGFNLYGTKAMIDCENTLKGWDGVKMSKTLENHLPLKHLMCDDDIMCKPYFMKMKTYSRKKEEAGDPTDCPVFEYWKVFDYSGIDHQCQLAQITCVECKARLGDIVRDSIKSNMCNDSCFPDIDTLLKYGAEVARQRIMEGELIKKHFI